MFWIKLLFSYGWTVSIQGASGVWDFTLCIYIRQKTTSILFHCTDLYHWRSSLHEVCFNLLKGALAQYVQYARACILNANAKLLLGWMLLTLSNKWLKQQDLHAESINMLFLAASFERCFWCSPQHFTPLNGPLPGRMWKIIMHHTNFYKNQQSE